MSTFISDLSHKEFPDSEKVSATTIRHSILDFIQKANPDFTHNSFLAKSELKTFREDYFRYGNY